MSNICCKRKLVVLGQLQRITLIQHHRRRATMTTSHQQYCMELVRRGDYESYLASLLLPQKSRAAAFAIRAFNVEVSQIQDMVSEPQIGLMRIQFWRDAIDRIFEGSPPETPIALELGRANKQHKFTKRWLTHMLDAREEVLQQKPHHDMTDVEYYTEKTCTAPLLLLLQCLGITDVQADHAASHVGKALGITTMIRAVPYHATRGRVHLPRNLLVKHRVSEEDILRGVQEQRVKDLIYDMASSAHQHITKARSMKSSSPKNTHLALLQTASCDSYLKTLQKADFHVFDSRLQQRNNWLPLLMWLQKSKRTF